MRVAETGLTMAEYFREESHKDGLLFIDNIFRFVQAGSEVSALMGRMPSAVGYQPTLANELGALQERITSTRDGSITSVQAVYVPADDLTDPAPATTFAHLDATTVLSRKIVEQGIYPAVDPLDSTSRILEADIVGEEHYRVARKVQATLQRYQELQDIINANGGQLKDAIGIPEDMLREAARMAVCKINIDSDLRLAMTAGIRETMAKNPDAFDPRKYMTPARDYIRELVKAKIVNVLGSDGKA